MKNKFSFWAKVLPLVILIAATLNTALNCDEGGVVLSPARLEIAPAELDFGENDNSLAFAVKNTGQQNLTWTVSESVDWISDFQSTTGKITGTGESQITVTIDRDRLSPGDNTGSIQVTAAADDGSALEGGAKNVTVKAHKPSPPEVSMSNNDISGIGSENVAAKGLIDNIGLGNITQHGHVWHTSPNPDLSDGSLSKTTLGVKTETGTFTSPLANLNPNATYYIRAYAINSAGITYSNEITFSTADNNAYTNIILSNAAIQENQASNTLIGVLSTSDSDAGDSHSYNLVSGTGSTDNNSFNINSNQLRSSNIFDFETKNSYSIRVRSTNLSTNDMTVEEAFTISVIDVNEAPTNITLSNSTIAENLITNTTIGTLTSSDPDAGDTHTYNLVSGTGSTDNSNFNINANQLRTSTSFDHESKNSHSIRIETRDSENQVFAKVFTITVTDVNEAPTNITLSNSTISENLVTNTTIGTLTSSDPDAGNIHTYSLVSGTGSTDNGNFNINANQLRTSTSFDHESKNSHSIRIETRDSENQVFAKVFTITVTDVNEAPTNITLSNSTIAENLITNTTIGTLTSSDPDAGDTHTYSLVSGTGSTDNASFNISGIALRSNAVFDFGTKNTYSIRIRSTDGSGANYEKSVTITITDVPNIIENIAKVTVSGGTFEKGCKSGRDDINGHSCHSDESPLHSVTVSSFKLSQYEITNAQYAAFLNALGGVSSSGNYNDPDYGTVTYVDIHDSDCMLYHSGGTFLVESGLDNYPMIEVSWYGANAFAKWAGGRLPTEAEWEFAARGGTSSQNYQFSGSNTVGDVTWYSSNSSSTGQSNFDGVRTHPVGTKAPNELGLYDMSGNVWEWCQDWYASYSSTAQTNPTGPSSGSNRVLRGGSWLNYATDLRVAYRIGNTPSNSFSGGGFRVYFP